MAQRHLIGHRPALCGVVVASLLLALRVTALAQAPQIPPAITTPDRVETRLGTLDLRGNSGEDIRQSGLHARIRSVREHLSGCELAGRS